MVTRVLVIGGYGNFGSFISARLAQAENIQLVIAGRSIDKARTLAGQLDAVYPPEIIALDIHADFSAALVAVAPDVVIHTSGPFQLQGYDVARACIDQGCHYIDLADGRDFVEGITALDTHAKQRGVMVVSGASSVPCLTSAIVDHYLPEFSRLECLDYGITTAQKTNRGLATTAAILSYTGKPFKTLIGGRMQDVYGWQSLRMRKYDGLGWRLLGNCNIPDLSLFPKRYADLKTVRFFAGIEVQFIHIGLWMLSWGVRFKLINTLEKAAPFLLKASSLFNKVGTDKSGFHMTLSGTGMNGNPQTITFELTARSGDGPYIPCMPAVLLAQKIADRKHGASVVAGAYPCMNIIGLESYLSALKGLDIIWSENRSVM